jgi:hypothetical protein
MVTPIARAAFLIWSNVGAVFRPGTGATIITPVGLRQME